MCEQETYYKLYLCMCDRIIKSTCVCMPIDRIIKSTCISMIVL